MRIHMYLLLYILQQTLKKFAQLFTDGYNITAQGVV